MAEEVGPSRLEECIPFWRRRIETGKAEGESDNWESHEVAAIHCSRRQWAFSKAIKSDELGYVELDVVRQPRRCPYYIKYQPGFGPEEHKELKRQAETKRAIFKASVIAAIIGALVGAAAAIIVQLISK